MTDAIQVLDEVTSGSGLTMAQAARLFPGSTGRGVDPATLWRWRTRGATAADGSRVRLECARVGCTWYTSRPALARFVARLSEQQSADPTPPPRTPTARRLASEAACAELERMGA